MIETNKRADIHARLLAEMEILREIIFQLNIRISKLEGVL